MVKRFGIIQMQLFMSEIGMKKVSVKKPNYMTETARGFGGWTKMARLMKTCNRISGLLV